MSQHADLVDTFRGFQHRYKWTQDETARNFLEVVSDLEWQLSDLEIVNNEDWARREADQYMIAKGYFSIRFG